MTKSRTLFLLLTLSLALHLSSSQDIFGYDGTTKLYNANEGSMYRHIYTTAVYYDAATPVATTNPSLAINKTMSASAFDNTEKISYGTALNLLDVGAMDTAAGQLLLEVKNVTINAARTQFTINLAFKRNQVSTFSTYKRLGFNVIFIGSLFNRESYTLASAFARNGQLVDVTDTATDDAAQFSFASNTGEASPFAYVTDSTTAGCGVDWSGVNPRIQVVGCVTPIFVAFLTGFNSGSATLEAASIVIKDKSITAASQVIVSPVQLDASNPQYLYQIDGSDSTIGPTIFYEYEAATNLLKQVQLSLVFVGLKTAAASYPTANFPDSFIVAVGGLNYGLTANNIPTTTTAIIDGLKTPAAALNLQTYNPQADSTMGHQFCGLTSIGIKTAAELVAGVPAAATPGATMPVNLLQTKSAASQYTSGACLLFASTATCTNNQVMALSPTSAWTLTGTSTAVTDLTLTTGTAIPKSLYTFNIATFNTNPTTTEVFLKNYTIPAGKTELSFYLELINNVAPAAGEVTYIVTINGVQYPPVSPTTANPSDQIVFHVPAGTTQVQTNVTVITKNVGGTVNNIRVLEGLYYYDSVINANGACVSSCPEVVNQTTGVAIDSNPPVCIYCPNDTNKYYIDGVCACKPYYFLDISTDTCTPCTDPLCKTCTTAAVCTVCAGNATLTAATPNPCACDNGFYRNGSICVACPIGCALCTGPNDCSQCRDSANATGFVTRLNETFACRCVNGFYDVNTTAVCSPCNPLCATCSGAANNCTSCNAALNFVQSQFSCVCQTGYYLLNNQCTLCNPICRTCDVSSIYCTSCPDLRVLSGTTNPLYKTCKCNQTAGLIELDYVCVDALCLDIDPFCAQCEIDATGLRIRYCTRCRDNRVVVGGQCVCQPGFFQAADGTCKPCGAGCQSCTNTTVCLTCATSSISNGDGTCSCRPGSTLVTFTNTMYCQPCDYNCAGCFGLPNNCTSCKFGFSLSAGGVCVCPQGTYASADGTQCISCPANCRDCNASGCINCITGYVIDSVLNQCTLSCAVGQFNAGTACRACPAGCASCFTEIICSSCLPNYFMYAGLCRTSCPDGSFSTNGQCVRCPLQCKTCTNAQTCSSCSSNFVLLAGRCVGDCPANTYYADGSCRACDSSCATCTGYATNCLTCPTGSIFYNGACYATCPVATVNGVCTNVCPGGTYLSGTSCLPCGSSCRTCFGTANNCTSCTSGLSSGGVCIDSCPAGTFASSGFCTACDASCRTCQNSPFNCNQCADGFIRSGANCIRSCGQSFYIDLATRTCLPCPTGCRTCTSGTQCTECIDPSTTFVNGVCQKACPQSANLINGVCVCSFGFLHQANCVSVCPEGFYGAADRTCAMCTSPCLGCTGSPTTCVTCIDGYRLDQASRTCVPTGACQYGAAKNIYGECVPICSNGYLYSTGCVFECPDKFQPNRFRGCVQSITPTYCQSPLFLLGSSCVANCGVGYWQNTATRTCDRCFANCAQCLSSSYCAACQSGFTLNFDQSACIASSSCAANQFIYQFQCVSACPVGTYAPSGQLCVRSCPPGGYLHPTQNVCYAGCPTQFYTRDVCYETCPANVQCMRNW